ncbi:MAG: I78 family peptidase inhibitor [Sulfitobacter sp.]
MRFIILSGVILAGCGAPIAQTSGPASTGGPDICNASAHQELIGKDAAASLVLPEPKRLIGPTDVATTDFVPTRLSVQLDGTDTIVEVTCG